MALRLTETDAVIYEIPKTGTTWIRAALKEAGVHYTDLNPNRDVCPRHSPPCCYPETETRIVTVRHPLSWLSSYWRFHIGNVLKWQPGTWYGHRLLGDQMPGSFEAFINHYLKKCPGFVTRMFEWFCGPEGLRTMNVVLKQETLACDLADCLVNLGFPRLHDQLASVKQIHVTDRKIAEWGPGQREQVEALEVSAIRRFYS